MSQVKSGLDLVGWDARASDGHCEKLLRSTVISLLDVFGAEDEEVLAEVRRRFAAHWDDSSVISSDFKTSLYKIVLRTAGASTAEYNQILKKSFYDTEDNSVRKYALHSLGAAGSIELKLRTLDWAVKSGDVKLQDFFYPIGAVSSSAAGCELAWKYFKENMVFIKDKLSKASPSLMDAVVVNSVNRFCTEEKAAEIEAFFRANPLPSSERKIGQVVESIRNTGAMLKRVQSSALADASFW